MGFFAQRCSEGKVAGIGSENGFFVNDLKTVKGVRDRILNGVFLKGEWIIYRFSDAMDESTYTEVARVTKG